MAKLPLNLTKSLKAMWDASGNANESGSIVLAGDQALVELAKAHFSVGGTIPASLTGPVGGPGGAGLAAGEVLVVFATRGEEAEARASLDTVAAKESVILAVDEGPAHARPSVFLPQ